MKLLSALLSPLMAFVVTVPAYAEPGVEDPPSNDNNGVLLADLQKEGIGYTDPNQAISAGQAVCGCIHNGISGLHLLKHLQETNPALTENGACTVRDDLGEIELPETIDEAEEPGGKGGGSKGGGGE